MDSDIIPVPPVEVMPYYSKYSDEARCEVDRRYVRSFVSSANAFRRESSGFVCSSYRVDECVRLRLGPVRLPFPKKCRILRFVCDSLHWVDDAGFEHALEFIREVVEHEGIDRLHFHYFKPKSPEQARRLFTALVGLGYVRFDHRTTKLYRCELASQSVLPSLRLKGKNRYKERKKLRDLADAFGETRIECYSAPSQEDAFFAAIRRLSGETWQRQSGLGTVVDSQQFREIYRLESGRGRMRSYVLFAGDRPVAYQFGTVYRDVYHYEYIGYDSAFGKFSPGQQLRLYSFDEMHGMDKINWVDFGHVEFDFKMQWSTESIELPDVSFYRKSLIARAALGLEKLKRFVKKPAAV